MFDLPGVNTVRKRLADGSVRIHYYHRATGTKLDAALIERAKAGDVAAAAAVRERLAELDSPKPKEGRFPPGTVGALIADYKASPEFTHRAEKTRKDYLRYLGMIEDKWGPLPAAGVRRKHVKALRDKYQDKARTANYLIQMVSVLMNLAIDQELRTDNPASRAGRSLLLETGEGHRPWEEDEIARYRAHHEAGTLKRVAFEMLLNLGQRGGDTIAMTRPHYRDGQASVMQEKTGARVWVPASEDLRAVLDPWLASHEHMSVLITPAGRSLKVDFFRHMMRDAYREAGLPDDVTTHGLRYTTATVLHELGCDWETIASITGHETVAMVRKYTAKKRRATIAIARLNRARRPADGG